MLPFLLSRSTSSHTLCVASGQAVWGGQRWDEESRDEAWHGALACMAQASQPHSEVLQERLLFLIASIALRT